MADLHISFVGPDQRLAIAAARRAGDGATAAAQSAVAAAAAETGAEAAAALTAAERAAIEAAIAGFPTGSGSLTIPVASRAIMAAIGTPAGAVYLYENGREGVFSWDASNLSAQVTNDPRQGIYVPPSSAPTGASGAWVRQDPVLIPEMWGIGGGTDDLAALRAAGYWACVLGRPLQAGAGPYWLTGNWVLGSLTDVNPAAGTIDGLSMPGRWNFICDAPLEDAFVTFANGNGVSMGDADFDIVTGAPANGHGSIRLVDTSNFHGGHFTKIGSSGAVPAVSGGSVFSVNGDCENSSCLSAVVEYAGGSASAVFASQTVAGSPKRVQVGYARCVAGQDGVDLSGVDGFAFEIIEGIDLTDADSSVLDCGNSSNGWVGFARGTNVSHGLTFKTEDSGGTHNGSNNVQVERAQIDGFTRMAVRLSSGATVTQTLHGIKIGCLTGATTSATSASRGLYFTSGDDAADPTRGFELGSGALQMNDGVAVEFAGGMSSYSIRNFSCNAPTALVDNTPGAFPVASKGHWENCELTGNFPISQKECTFRDFHVTGDFSAANGFGNRYYACSSKSVDLNWDTGLANSKDVIVDGWETLNAAARAFRVRIVGASGTIHDLHLRNVINVDTQGVPTSTGFLFDNAEFDHCSMIGCKNKNLADNDGWGFPGLNSFNADNFVQGPVEALFGGGTVSMLHAGRIIKESDGGANWTLPSDATAAIPLGTKVTLWAPSGANFVAGAGATMNGSGAVAAGETKTATKIASNEWLVS